MEGFVLMVDFKHIVIVCLIAASITLISRYRLQTRPCPDLGGHLDISPSTPQQWYIPAVIYPCSRIYQQWYLIYSQCPLMIILHFLLPHSLQMRMRRRIQTYFLQKAGK
ncbi:hypothetical protein GDO81_027032 [Engystomops pustulosus]|uniref:Uncharacterized protein n=1 Tax=Engystomops pustulosus TaxID=76066 RepID=A0AAV6YKG1_ENGPU|nr:hypothetical protein GDO81_027032 [Engystomops pustulosus]